MSCSKRYFLSWSLLGGGLVVLSISTLAYLNSWSLGQIIPALLDARTESRIDWLEMFGSGEEGQWEEVLTRQRKRKTLLKEECEALELARGRLTNRAHVDDRHHVIMCSIPKVGSTVWKRTLMLLAGNVSERELMQSNSEYISTRNPSQFAQHAKVLKHYGLHKRGKYGKKKFKHRIKKYFTFMFVRNPWSRLVSAYLDKFTVHYPETRVPYEHKALKILKRYRWSRGVPSGNIDDGSMLEEHVPILITFPEFLTYIVDEWESGRHADHHWTRYVDYCKPCTSHYDFIGHMETFQEDAAYIIQHVFKSNLNISRVMNPKLGPAKADPHQNTSAFFSQVNASLLHRVKEYLFADLRVFGYDNEPF